MGVFKLYDERQNGSMNQIEFERFIEDLGVEQLVLKSKTLIHYMCDQNRNINNINDF